MKIKARINLVLSSAAMLAMAVIGAVSYLGLRGEALAVARREAELHLLAIDAARAVAAEAGLPAGWSAVADARLLAQVNRHYAGHEYAEVPVRAGTALPASLARALQELRDHPAETVLQVDTEATPARLTFVRVLRASVPLAGSGVAAAPAVEALQVVAIPQSQVRHRALDAFWRQLLGMAVPVGVLFLALNLMLRRLVVNPVHDHQRALRRLATQDSLTGAANRRGFMDRLLRAQGEAEQHDGTLALVMVDLDHFKRINDEHGHGVGDAVLREVAQRLRRQIRRADLLGRLGGEEFAILLPGTDLVGARVQAEHLLAALRGQPFPSVGRVTASLGVSQWNGRETAADWLHRTDLALYEAKHRGRDRVIVAEDLDTDPASVPPDRPA